MGEKPYNRPRILRGQLGRADTFRFFPLPSATSVVKKNQRTAARGEDWDKSLFSRLDGAASAEDLAARAEEIRRRLGQAVCAIHRRKGWG